MMALMLAGLKGAAIKMLGAMMTEALFVKVISRLTVSLLERNVKSKKSTVYAEAIKPIIEKLKEQY